jgi:hypothetical protein
MCACSGKLLDPFSGLYRRLHIVRVVEKRRTVAAAEQLQNSAYCYTLQGSAVLRVCSAVSLTLY